MSIKVRGCLGRTNRGPLKPVVIIDGDVYWLSAAQARKLASRLLKAANEAEEKARLRGSAQSTGPRRRPPVAGV